eukprot:gene6658-6311_t
MPWWFRSDTKARNARTWRLHSDPNQRWMFSLNDEDVDKGVGIACSAEPHNGCMPPKSTSWLVLDESKGSRLDAWAEDRAFR